MTVKMVRSNSRRLTGNGKDKTKKTSSNKSVSAWIKSVVEDGGVGHYLQESSIHGVKYIGLRGSHIAQRIFWLIALLASFAFAIFLVAQVVEKYRENPVIISFQPMETHVSQVPFPAITLCNVNMIKNEVVGEMDRLFFQSLELFMDNKENPNIRSRFYGAISGNEYLTQFCLAAPSFRRLINETLVDVNGDPDTSPMVQEQLLAMIDQGYISQDVSFETIATQLMDMFQSAYYRGVTNCRDMILKCMWAGKQIPCDKDLFYPVRTQHGRCCMFNRIPDVVLKRNSNFDMQYNVDEKTAADIKLWIEEADKGNGRDINDLILAEAGAESMYDEYLYYQKSGGKSYGLSILVNPEVETYSTCTTNDGWGFKLLAHSTISSPDMDFGTAIPPSSEIFVEVEPQMTIATRDELGSIDIKKRGCYFSTDKQTKLKTYRFYAQGNCMDECIAQITYENCSCILDFMPRYNMSQKLCGARQLECSNNVRYNIMRSGRLCSHCRPSCTEISYKTKLSYFPLRQGFNATSFFYKRYSDNVSTEAVNYSILHIFMGSDSFNAKERKRLYDFWDLLANAGGLVGLTMGISILSLVELCYFLALYTCCRNCRPDNEQQEDEESDNYNNHNRFSINSGRTTKDKCKIPANQFLVKLRQRSQSKPITHSNADFYPSIPYNYHNYYSYYSNGQKINLYEYYE